MSCTSCGAPTKPGSNFCKDCGAPTPHRPPPPIESGGARSGGGGPAEAQVKRTVIAADGSAKVITGDDIRTYEATNAGSGTIVQGDNNKVSFGIGPVTLWIGLALVAVVAIVFFFVNRLDRGQGAPADVAVSVTPILIPTTSAASLTAVDSTPAPTPTPPPDSLLDSFDDNRLNWPTGPSAYILDGAYVVTGADRSTMVWTPVREWEDFRLSVDVAFDGQSPTINSAGILFRVRPSGAASSYYAYLLDSEGRFSLGRVIDGNWNQVVPWTPMQGGFLPDQINKMSIICQGDSLALLLNGAEVHSVRDALIPRGYVGFMADAGTKVTFDNLSLDAR